MVFPPLNDVDNHLVCYENSSSIEKVMVEGDIVMENGGLAKVTEAVLLEELPALMPEFLGYHGGVEKHNEM